AGPGAGKPAAPGARGHRKPRTMTGPMDSNEMLFRTWYPGEGPGNTASRPPAAFDDDIGNRIDSGAGRPRDKAPGPAGDAPGAARKRRKPGGGQHRPREGNVQSGRGGTAAAQGDNIGNRAPGGAPADGAPRKRRGPVRRGRGKPGGGGGGGNGGDAPGNG
ncbi:MAG: hypothetical protein KF823_16140, partial [Xanthomonadales bacterium]|nr:hypothetical protein [Xanthomonadales bacterium]